MQKRYASAGPNKQMYEIYNMSIRESNQQANSFRSGFPKQNNFLNN